MSDAGRSALAGDPASLAVSGYTQWDLIYEGRRNALYRVRQRDGSAAIVKTPAAEPLGPYEVARIQYEYAALTALDVAGVARPLGLAQLGRRPLLVLEDAGQKNLLQTLEGKPYPVGKFLNAAIALTRTVGAVHERGFVHRDLCPENIVCADEKTGLTLVDFDRVMPMAHADTAGLPGEQFLGTLPYASPEQHGTSGHVVDYRTDYYSLGATFYEMLTGVPPFDAADEALFLEGQLSGRAVPPHERNRQVPPGLSRIVLRLLAPSPDERYVSAAAIETALQAVLTSFAGPTSAETP